MSGPSTQLMPSSFCIRLAHDAATSLFNFLPIASELLFAQKEKIDAEEDAGSQSIAEISRHFQEILRYSMKIR